MLNKRILHEYLIYSAGRGESDLAARAATRKALREVLPKIMENELSPRQKLCLEMRFSNMMTQREIARRLGLSQSTVSRHIKSAVSTVANRLEYCAAALRCSNELWLKRDK